MPNMDNRPELGEKIEIVQDGVPGAIFRKDDGTEVFLRKAPGTEDKYICYLAEMGCEAAEELCLNEWDRGLCGQYQRGQLITRGECAFVI